MRLREIITASKISAFALAIAAAVTAGCGGGGYTSLYSAAPTRKPAPSPSPSVVPSPSPSPSHSPSPSPSPSGSPSPSPSPSPATQIVGVKLSNEMQDNDPTYGTLLGYFDSNGGPSNMSSVVNLTASTPVYFHNFDDVNPHTASFLGDASVNGANFPSTFTGSASQSPAGAIISTTDFSSGNLNPNQKSLIYNSGPPGYYMFGCAYHYISNGMRTVIIVQ